MDGESYVCAYGETGTEILRNIEGDRWDMGRAKGKRDNGTRWGMKRCCICQTKRRKVIKRKKPGKRRYELELVLRSGLVMFVYTGPKDNEQECEKAARVKRVDEAEGRRADESEEKRQEKTREKKTGAPGEKHQASSNV